MITVGQALQVRKSAQVAKQVSKAFGSLKGGPAGVVESAVALQCSTHTASAATGCADPIAGGIGFRLVVLVFFWYVVARNDNGQDASPL